MKIYKIISHITRIKSFKHLNKQIIIEIEYANLGFFMYLYDVFNVKNISV
jgi:hypothetical protein